MVTPCPALGRERTDVSRSVQCHQIRSLPVRSRNRRSDKVGLATRHCFILEASVRDDVLPHEASANRCSPTSSGAVGPFGYQNVSSLSDGSQYSSILQNAAP